MTPPTIVSALLSASARITACVPAPNGAVSKAESIRRFVVVPNDWTEQGGQLTASMKLRRNVVLAEHGADVEALYR